MKKKLLLFLTIISATFSFWGLFNHSAKIETSFAYQKTETTYTIKNYNNSISVLIGEDEAQTDLATDLETLAEAFETITQNNQTSPTDPIEIYFENLTLSSNEQIEISSNYLLAGTINSSNTTSLFSINNTSTQNTLNLTFLDFTLNNTVENSSEISLINVESESNPTFITLNNAYFNLNISNTPAVQDNTYAIYFASTNHNIHLENKIDHTTKFLYNYLESINLTVNESNFSTTSLINISAPYDAKSNVLCSSVSYEIYQNLSVEAESDLYISTIEHSNSGVIISSELKLFLNINGGEYADSYTASDTFYFKTIYSIEILNLPTSNDISKQYSHLVGWYGAIEHNQTTYYFDQICLENFVKNASNINDISTYFKTDLSEFNTSTSFSKYSYKSKGTDSELAEYLSVYVMAELEKPITFIAHWEFNSYKIEYDSNGGSEVESTTHKYNSIVPRPTTPTKEGFTFNGWYEDEEFKNYINFESFTMPANDIKIYAEWLKNRYNINYITNNDTTIETQKCSFKSTINLPDNLTKTGYTFAGWYEDENFTTLFELTNMPSRHLTLYAKWDILKFEVYFNSNGGTMLPVQNIDYGGEAKRPTDPTRIGYSFGGWYSDKDCLEQNKIVFETNNSAEPYEYLTIYENKNFYAKWNILQYSIEIFTNDSNQNSYIKNIDYNDIISLPNNLTKANFKFLGWYEDSEFTKEFKLNTMPARNLTAFAKWSAKQTISIDESSQIYSVNSVATFSNFSTNSNFVVKYHVDNNWVDVAPTKIGSYDVLITRAEDDNYAEFSKILKNALIINPIEINLTWLITLMFVISALEIIVIIILRILRKMKFNMPISFSIVIGSNLIRTNQAILIGISGFLMIFLFIMMINEMVKLHRTIPLNIEKEDSKNNIMKHFEYNESQLNENYEEYSAEDIVSLLNNDTVGKSLKEKHNLESDDNKDNAHIKNEMYENIEIIDDDDEIIDNNNSNNHEVYDSDDHFVRKDPNDYYNDDNK